MMAKYRYTDEQQTNKHGQILGFAHWMGGPDLTYVKGIVCDDGSRRTWFKSAEPDTYFSVPGYVHCKGKKVAGYMYTKETDSEALYCFRECAHSNFSRRISLLHPNDESSHGSLLDHDVAQGIIDLCQRRSIYLEIGLASQLNIVVRHNEVLQYLPDAAWNDPRVTWHEANLPEAWQIISDAMDELTAVCPEGYYFGSHPRDGASFGAWEAEE
jgi:hypothetical protein